MSVFGGYDESERVVSAQLAAIRAENHQPGLDQSRLGAYGPADGGDRQAGRMPTGAANDNVTVNTQVADRLDTQQPVVGRDGQQEREKPVLDTVNYNARGQTIGYTHYLYSPDGQSGAKLNGFIDRDLQGNITELVIRKPKTADGQSDQFFEFRAPPGHPFDKHDPRIFGGTDAQGVNHAGIINLLNPSVTPEQSRQNQQILNRERPLADCLQNNRGQEIMALRVDAHTGQRFAIRDMRYDSNTQQPFIDPETHKPINRPNPVLCWQNPNGTTNRFEISNMTHADQDDLGVARGHGNMRAPLQLLSGYWKGRPLDPQGEAPPPPRPVLRQPAAPPPYPQGYDNGGAPPMKR